MSICEDSNINLEASSTVLPDLQQGDNGTIRKGLVGGLGRAGADPCPVIWRGRVPSRSGRSRGIFVVDSACGEINNTFRIRRIAK